MPWLASLITDYQLHRRRLVIACIGIVCGLAVLAGAVLDAHGALIGKDLLSAAFGLFLTLNFVRIAWQEWSRMKESSR